MADQSARIEGRVAAILNARELVINIGSLAGVKFRNKFAVLAEARLEIRDPTTDTVLDTVEREKVRVQAVEVRDRITICRTYRMKGGGVPRVSDFLSAIGRESIAETLRISDDSSPAPLSEEESYVKVNDRVVLVADD